MIAAQAHISLGSVADLHIAGGAGGDVKRVGDHLLDELERALAWDKPALFVDCVGWAKAALVRLGVPASALTRHLEQAASALRDALPAEAGTRACDVVVAALQALPGQPADQPAFLQPGAPLSPLALLYFRALLRGDRQLASRLVMQAVAQGAPVREIYLHVFQPAQYEIGRLWQLNQVSVAEEHYGTAATQLIMSQLYPHVFASERIGRTVVAACVSGDLHELGVRMVADFFEMAGWDSYYTGASTPMTGVVQAVVERRADLLAISATITHHVPDVARLIGLVRAHPACGAVKILVGGFPFNCQPELWRQVGADGSGTDAETAVIVGHDLVGAPRPRP